MSLLKEGGSKEIFSLVFRSFILLIVPISYLPLLLLLIYFAVS